MEATLNTEETFIEGTEPRPSNEHSNHQGAKDGTSYPLRTHVPPLPIGFGARLSIPLVGFSNQKQTQMNIKTLSHHLLTNER